MSKTQYFQVNTPTAEQIECAISCISVPTEPTAANMERLLCVIDALNKRLTADVKELERKIDLLRQ